MAPQAPPQGPPQNHARASSFFSFRSKPAAPLTHQRTTSMGSLSVDNVSLSQRGVAAQQPSVQQPIPQYQQQPPMQPTVQPTSSPPIPASQKNTQLPPQAPTLHPEIRSIVNLVAAHAHKVYFSGPLVRRIERQPDGSRPPPKDEGWTDVWAQLGGTTLSIWGAKQIQEASKLGKQVPPTYINTTDAFVQVLGIATTPATAEAPAQKYDNVLTLNTAGSNLLLFSCPSAEALRSWVTAFRLSAWEKSRLEEIYTAHLIRLTLGVPNAPSTLGHGRMEGWVRIRVAGQTDWKRVWMIVNASSESGSPDTANFNQFGVGGATSPPSTLQKKKRISLFSRDSNVPFQAIKPHVSMFASPKPKDKKKALLTLRDVTQVFAVYPERPELISRSTLIKLEGSFGDEDTAGSMKLREAWLLLMPDSEGIPDQAAEMLRWVVALHDAFEMYGRPEAWVWDPRNPVSLMFAYPVGPNKDLLFLDRELAERLDPRDDRTSSTRSQLINILLDRMRGINQAPIARPVTADGPPSLPPIEGLSDQNSQHQLPPARPASADSAPTLPAIAGLNGGQNTDVLAIGPLRVPSVSSNTASTNSENTDKPPSLPAIVGVGNGNVQQQDALNAGAPQLPSLGSGVASDSSQQQISSFTTAPSRLPSISSNLGHIANSLENGSSSNPLSRAPSSVAQSSQALPHSDRPMVLDLQDPAPLLSRNVTTSPASILQQPQLSEAGYGKPTPVELAVASARGSIESTRPLLGSQVKTGYGSNTPSTSHSPLISPTPPPNRAPSVSNYTSNGPTGNTPSMTPLPLAGNTPSTSYPPSVAQSPIVRSDSLLDAVNEPPETQAAGPPSPTTPSIISSAGPLPNPRSRTSSMLTSPFSDNDHIGTLRSPFSEAGHGDDQGSDRASVLTSPHSPDTMTEFPAPPSWVRPAAVGAQALSYAPTTAPASRLKAEDSGNFLDETAGALYYMQQFGEVDNANQNYFQSPRVPTTIAERDDDEDESVSSQSSPQTRLPSPRPLSPKIQSKLVEPRQSTAFIERSVSAQATSSKSVNDRFSPSRQIGRKPSGARSQGMRSYTTDGVFSSSQTLTEEESQSEGRHQSPQNNMATTKPSASVPSEDSNLDVLAALSYLSTEDTPEDNTPSSPTQAKVGPLNINKAPSPPPIAPTLSERAPYRSSFAPSKQAAERKAKAQAQQAAHLAAVHKPGRANGNGKRKSKVAGAWNESSDEEEEEEEEDEDEDEQVDSDAEQNLANMRNSAFGSSNTSLRHSQNQGPPMDHMDGPHGPSHLRPPRTLPQVPGGSYYPEEREHNPPPRRMAQEQYMDAMRRTHHDGTQIRTQAEVPQPGAARHNMWSQVLDAGRKQPEEPQKDTFVQLDTAEKLTKAFTPQGLLSAGLQDKQDRSAKRQEELARETGASLINVPNKPPPPQMGLLGAITAHERERKREGGVGAALTEREREKRLAEDRQRRFDDHQRQQLDQMQQGGSMYGQFPGYNMNPMMMMNPMMGMNPMMAGGMAPMMTGGGMAPMMTGQMGYPGMMPGFNPHMFAAQQAAQAYQQAMMAFSVAGSQMGGENGGMQQQQPNVTGGGMGNMGFDPRMSMMGVPMMTPQPMGPMGIQTTGMSTFDPRFGPGMNNSPGVNDLARPTPGFASKGKDSSRGSSPARGGSPMARPASRPATPKT